MRTFQSRVQLSLATIEVGAQVRLLGETISGSDGACVMQVFDSSLSNQLPSDRVTLTNGNIAVIVSDKVRKTQAIKFTPSVETATDLDLKEGKWFDLTLDKNIDTLSFSNVSVINNVAETIDLKINQDGTGGYVITWPVSIVWSTGSAPVVDITPNSTSFYQLVTFDQGVTWFGFILTGDYIPTADIDVTVLPKVEWTPAYIPTDGNDASGSLFPELIEQEVFVVYDEEADNDEMGTAQFFIPANSGYATGIKYYQPIGADREFTVLYLDGAVAISKGKIRAIYHRDKQDLPPVPTITKTA